MPALQAAGLGPDRFDIVTPDVPDGSGLADVAATMAARCGPAAWLGYSMGGRIALHVALARPDATGSGHDIFRRFGLAVTGQHRTAFKDVEDATLARNSSRFVIPS